METHEIGELKGKLKTTWSAGDYGMIAKGLEESAKAFLARHQPKPGERMLDVACGNGQLAIPAARSGADVTGLDLAEQWIVQARDRASAEDLDAQFDVGDVEAMPYPDGRFDLVISLIGAMFAPRPERAADEMKRVCRSGGRIVMGNWEPDGFVGAFFRTVATHVPPPDMPSPLLWGQEETVRERFADGIDELTIRHESLHFSYPIGPDALAEHYLKHFGPTRKAAEALDERGREALRRDLAALWADANTASDGGVEVDAAILDVSAVRA